MSGGVGVNECLRVSKRIKECRERLDLIGESRFLLGMRREPEDLVDEQLAAGTLARRCDPSNTAGSSDILRGYDGCYSPEDDRLRLHPSPHEEVYSCSKIVEMRWEASCAGEGEAGVLVTSLLVLLCADVVDISESLVGINDDEA